MYKYLNNNKDGIIPWHNRELGEMAVPEPPEGVFYSHLGAMENNNCTIITQRMKGRRMSWSTDGANNLAKILTSHENKTLESFIKRMTDSDILSDYIDTNTKINLYNADKVSKTVGKGNGVLPISPIFRSWKQTPEIKAILSRFDCGLNI